MTASRDNAAEINEALALGRDPEQRDADRRDELVELLDQMDVEQRRAFLRAGRALARPDAVH